MSYLRALRIRLDVEFPHLPPALSFQGEESTVIIVSLVRSNPHGSIGFLKSPNRSNVLLSRAKHGMYLIGKARSHDMLNLAHTFLS